MKAQDEKVIFNITVKTSNDNRLESINSILNFFEESHLEPSIDHYEFYLILDEAITNAMEHGNQWNHNKLVTLKVFEPQEKKVTLSIEDEGSGFNPDEIVSKLNGTASLNLRGRGIFIIKKFCNVTWFKNGREIQLHLNLKNK